MLPKGRPETMKLRSTRVVGGGGGWRRGGGEDYGPSGEMSRVRVLRERGSEFTCSKIPSRERYSKYHVEKDRIIELYLMKIVIQSS